MSDIGLIVGSGLPRLDLDVVERSQVDTPYGSTSSPLLTVSFGGRPVTALARHGEGKGIPPHEVNYRANLWALHRRGVRRCVAINVVGSIDEDFRPGGLAVPDQLIDYTWGRESTFSNADTGVVHVEFAEPFDPQLRRAVLDAGAAAGLDVRDGGVYGVTQGPRLETRAEIGRLARDGCAMVGMTALPEAALARELGIGYSICALSVNWAAGRGEAGGDIHAQIDRYLTEGMGHVAGLLERLMPRL